MVPEHFLGKNILKMSLQDLQQFVQEQLAENPALTMEDNARCPVCGCCLVGDFCPACAESVLDAAESNRVMREMRAFSKQVNAAIVDPGFIADVRKKLDLDQREAAEIFGGGINAFSRYENGKTKPPLALVKLFKLLDRHPDLLNEVRTA